MNIQDQQAASELLRLLETMRESGRKQGRIEILVNNGNVSELRIVKIGESVQLVAS